MSAYQRNKGHRFERSIASSLRAIGLTTRRGAQSWACGPIGYAGKDPDVVVEELPDLWIECKVGARPPIWKAMDQACDDAPDGRTPVVIVHRDNGRTLVCVEFEDWLEQIREQLRREKIDMC